MKLCSKKLAIIYLLLNIFLLPGIGTLLADWQDTGIIQMALILFSIPLMLFGVGFLLFFIVWIWGIYSGIQIIRTHKQQLL